MIKYLLFLCFLGGVFPLQGGFEYFPKLMEDLVDIKQAIPEKERALRAIQDATNTYFDKMVEESVRVCSDSLEDEQMYEFQVVQFGKAYADLLLSSFFFHAKKNIDNDTYFQVGFPILKAQVQGFLSVVQFHNLKWIDQEKIVEFQRWLDEEGNIFKEAFPMCPLG